MVNVEFIKEIVFKIWITKINGEAKVKWVFMCWLKSLKENSEVTSGSIIFKNVIACCLKVFSELSILCAYDVSKCDSSK